MRASTTALLERSRRHSHLQTQMLRCGKILAVCAAVAAACSSGDVEESGETKGDSGHPSGSGGNAGHSGAGGGGGSGALHASGGGGASAGGANEGGGDAGQKDASVRDGSSADAKPPVEAEAGPPPNVTYASPLVIDHGGTFTGNWESTNPSQAAVKVTTTDAVIIENCNIRSMGPAFEALNGDANITIRHCYAEARNPRKNGQQKGRFADIGIFKSVIIERNEVVGFAGIRVLNFGDAVNKTGQSVAVRFNLFRNVDGRKSDGGDGYLTDLDGSFANIVGLNTVRSAHVEIAWNETVNQPYQSRVEDAYSTYESSGTANDWINIHDNYTQGGYAPGPSAQVDYSGQMTNAGDAPGKDDVGYVHVHHNQVVNFENGAYMISAGHHNEVDHNRAISAKSAPDGTLLGGNWRTALTVWDFYDGASGGFWHDNSMHDNEVNVVKRDGTMAGNFFTSVSGSNTESNNTDPLGHPATTDDERAEYQRWKQKLTDSGTVIGK